MSSPKSNQKLAKGATDEDNEEEPEWLAMIFRREVDGWKKLSFGKGNEHIEYSPVIPCVGCILLAGVRQKWTLKNETHTGTIIRRDNKLLLRSNGTIRVLMLQFASLEDCLAFSDRFVELNPPPAPAPAAATTAAVVAASPEKQRGTEEDQQQQQQQPPSAAGQDQDQDNNKNGNPNQLEQPSTQQLMANGLVTQLLHDQDFLRFVHKLETHIKSTTDGSMMLEGLQQRDLSGM